MITDQAAFLLDFCKLIEYATSLGFQVTAGELLRTKEQQDLYVKTGKSKTMNSRHLEKMAGDLNFFQNGKWINGLPAKESAAILKKVGVFWESLSPHNRWGGSWRGLIESGKSTFYDVPHFERV